MHHLAMIMDGNRRWARENKLEALSLGHKEGMESIKRSIKFCLDKNIKYLSLYTFSLENFRRGEKEKKYLFDSLNNYLREHLEEFIEKEVRLRFVGDRDYFPSIVVDRINEAEEKTKNLEKLCVNFLFCYGSKQEIIHAAKKVAKKVKDGDLDINEIDEDSFRKEMWMNGAPDPDVIVRTGKTLRISNFLLFQAAYSEFIFLDCYWPEVDEAVLQSCVDRFYEVKRNFGR